MRISQDTVSAVAVERLVLQMVVQEVENAVVGLVAEHSVPRKISRDIVDSVGILVVLVALLEGGEFQQFGE